MHPSLTEALAQLNLQPGQVERVPVEDYEVEIRRLPMEESEFADTVMLQPWVEFPRGTPSHIVIPRRGELPWPDPPIIPPDYEDLE